MTREGICTEGGRFPVTENTSFVVDFKIISNTQKSFKNSKRNFQNHELLVGCPITLNSLVCDPYKPGHSPP